MKKHRILLVEDEAIIGMDIKDILINIGYEVPALASSGEEAIEKASAIVPDLILMDIILGGGIDGIEAARTIRRAHDIPVVYLTGNADMATVKRARETDPYGYVLKPVDIQHLFSTIDTALHRNQLEARLKESEEKFRRIIDTAAEGIWAMDSNFITTFVNRQMANMIGYEEAEMIGKPVHYFMFETDLDDHRKKMVNRTEGLNEQYERRFRRSDGSPLWTIVTATALTDNHGAFNGSFAMFTDITKRKRAEEALKESEEKYRRIVDTASEGIWVMDADYITTFVNRQMARMLGYEENEMLGKPIEYFAFEEELPDNRLKMENRKHGIEEQYERRLRRKDGSSLWALITATPIFDRDGTFNGSFGMLTDITDRKKAETALRESEERYRNIFENAMEGIYQTTPDGRYLSVNPAFARMAGFASPEEMIASVTNIGNERYVNPEDRERFKRIMEEKGIVEGFEAEVIRKDGTPFWISINGRAVRDNNGRIIYYEGTNIDITQRKKTEEALREQEKLFRLITENMYDLVSQTDTEGRFVYVSPSNRIVLGYEPEEMLGHHILERVHPDDAPAVAKAVEQAMAEKTGGRIEYRYQHRDGHYLWLETVGSLLFDDEGLVTGAVFSARDITGRKNAEMALRDSEELYRAIVENTHDAIYIYRDSLLIYVNQRLCQILGYAAEELLGTNMLHLIHPEDRAMIIGYTERRARDDNPPEWYKGRVATKDGSTRIIEFRPSKINYQGGYAVLGAARDITEQEEAEKALRESEEKYRKIFNNIQDTFYQTDINGIIIEISPSIERHSGFSREELIGSPVDTVYLNKQDRLKLLAEVQEHDEVFDFEVPLLHKSGRVLQVSVNAHLLRDNAGRPAGVEGSLRDITERRRAEEALRESEEKYKTLANNIPDTIYSLDNTGTITAVNAEALKLFGYGPEEIIGKQFSQIIHPEDRAMALNSYLQAIRERREYTRGLEFRINDRDGGVHWVELHSHMRFNTNNTLLGEEGVLRDITDRKRAESALKESQERLQGIFEASQAGILVVNPDGLISLVNRRMAEMFGCSVEELTGTRYMDRIHESDRGIATETFDSLIRGSDTIYQAERHYLRFDGSDFWGYVSSKRLEKEDGSTLALLGVIADITDQKKAAEKIRRSLAEKEVLLRELHHRVKNNYQIIVSLLNLQARGIADMEARRQLNEARDRIRSMSLIHEKLMQSQDIAHIDFLSYITSIANELYAGYMGSAGRITLRIEGEKIRLSIEQAIPCGLIANELLTNSFKYAFPPDCTGKGEIRLAIHEMEEEMIEIVIADNGIGIPDAIHFETTTSLGLSLVQMLTKQAGGTVDLDRKGGTVFRIRLKKR